MRKDELLDAEAITRNLRRWHPGGRCVIATRTAPFGEAAGTNAWRRRLHRVEGVRVDFMDASQASFVAVWKCGSSSGHPRLLNNPSDSTLPLCPKCFA